MPFEYLILLFSTTLSSVYLQAICEKFICRQFDRRPLARVETKHLEFPAAWGS